MTDLEVVKVMPSGATKELLRRSPGSTFNAVASSGGTVIAADAMVRVADERSGAVLGEAAAGFAPRTIRELGGGTRPSGFITGSTDGTAALVSRSGAVEWTVDGQASIVGEAEARAGSVYVLSEQFDYSHRDGWRFRCVLQRFSPEGRAVGTTFCPWRSQSSIPHFAGADGARAVIFNGSDLFSFAW